MAGLRRLSIFLMAEKKCVDSVKRHQNNVAVVYYLICKTTSKTQSNLHTFVIHRSAQTKTELKFQKRHSNPFDEDWIKNNQDLTRWGEMSLTGQRNERMSERTSEWAPRYSSEWFAFR